MYKIEIGVYDETLFPPIETLVVTLRGLGEEIDYDDAEMSIRTALTGCPIYFNQVYAVPFEATRIGLAAVIVKNLGNGVPCGRLTEETDIEIESKYLAVSEHVRLRKAFDPSKWDFRTSEILLKCFRSFVERSCRDS